MGDVTPAMRHRDESPTLQRIREEVGWNPYDDEPTDFDVLERYISSLEATVAAHDMLRDAR